MQRSTASASSALLLLALAAGCGGSPPAVAPRVAAPPPTARAAIAPAPSLPPPPPTRRDDVREVLHGVEIVDPYRWLEDKQSPETRAWIDAQNRYAHALLEPVPGRAALRAELETTERYDRISGPGPRGKRIFLWKKAAAEEQWSYWVRGGIDGADTLLLDPRALSDASSNYTVESTTKDGTRLVYGVRLRGEDETELHVMDVDGKKELPDVLPRALYRGVSLEPDGRAFYYALQDRAKGMRVRHHVIGTPPSADVEAFGDGHGPDDWLGAGVSRNGRHVIFVVQHGWRSSEILVQDLPAKKPPLAVTPKVDALFDAAYADDRLIVFTNWQAPNGRIVEIDPAHPEPEKWRTVVPTGSDAIRDWFLVGGRVLVSYLHDVASKLAIYSLAGEAQGELPMPGLGDATHVSGQWEDDTIYFAFQSFALPWSIFRADLATRKVEAWWRPKVAFDPNAFETKQVWVASKDGTRIPMFVTAKKGIVFDGNRPTLLHGYGGFDSSETPFFSPEVAKWLEQGGVYCSANIRGGGEFGEEWHRAGMLDKKQNVFDDFIAAAEWLVAHRVTRPERLAIEGGSNGGLLVMAAMTQRPELFRAVIARHPDLDIVGYPRYPDNNPPAMLEYGDARKPEEFPFILRYSPYQHVTPGTRYPAVLLTSGDGDTRAPPAQARKMTARLQAATSSGRPVVLLYDPKAGHAGQRPTSTVLDDIASELAFLDWQLEVSPADAR